MPPAPVRTPLGPSELNKRWYLDVNTAVAPAPAVWTPVNGITEFKNSFEGNDEDDSDFDSAGWAATTVTGAKWGVEVKVRRAGTSADKKVYDPGQEFLRQKQALFGVANRAEIRFYEMGNARVEAYTGFVAVAWALDGGDSKGLDRASLTLSGQGKRTSIAHPEPLT